MTGTNRGRLKLVAGGRPGKAVAERRRTPPGRGARLVLTEMAASAVFDRGDGDLPEGVHASGSVRETCPHCRAHLQLVLRQEAVRLAHLFCEHCVACFDAHYPDGRCALTT